jgi:hypothetical protein
MTSRCSLGLFARRSARAFSISLIVRHLAPVQQRRKTPVVLSQDEVARLIEAAPSLKYKAALSVASTGVRGRAPEGVRYRQRAHDAPGRRAVHRAKGYAGSIHASNRQVWAESTELYAARRDGHC